MDFKHKLNSNPILVGNIELTPFLNFFDIQNSKLDFSVKFESAFHLRLNDSGNVVSDTINYSEILCSLFSLYSCLFIDYLKIVVYNKDKMITIFNNSNHDKYLNVDNQHYRFNFEEFNTFILKFDFQKLLSDKIFLKKLVEYRLVAYSTMGITKFMMYYLIVESIKDKELMNGGKDIFYNLNLDDGKDRNDISKEIIQIIEGFIEKNDLDDFKKERKNCKNFFL
jgi:hypothetical protein